MRGGNKNALKYNDLNEFYYAYEGEKPRYSVFMSRVNQYGYSKEDAIKQKAKPRKTKSHVDENGRECNKCGIYKTRDKFSKSKKNHCIYRYTSICKDCRNEYKKQYRSSELGKKKTAEYRNSRRKLSKGQQIMINDEVREILDYQNKKGYLIRSLFSGEEKRFSASDNFYNKKNKLSVRKFTVLNNAIELIEAKKEEEPKQTFKLSLDDMFEDDYYF